MTFLDRGRGAAPGRFTRVKVQLFFAGAAVLFAGIALGRDALVLLAIGILAVGFLLRFADRKGAYEPEEAEEGGEVDDEGEEHPPPFEEERRTEP